MRALVGSGEMDFVLGQVTAVKGEDGQLSALTVRRENGEIYDLACDDMLPFFGLTMKLGPIANWGLNLHENLVPVDTAKFETSAPGIFADRRHQHLSGQAQADPVRLSRGRARRPARASLRLSGQEAHVPVHDVFDQPAAEAWRELTEQARPGLAVCWA